MTTQQLLDVLRDARELGDADFERSVLEQLGLDAVYVRFETRQCRLRPYRTVDDEYEDADETIEEFRARIGQRQRDDDRRDWLAWQRRARFANISLLSDIYKARYNDQAIADIANRPSPFFAMMEKETNAAFEAMRYELSLPLFNTPNDQADALMYAYRAAVERGGDE